MNARRIIEASFAPAELKSLRQEFAAAAQRVYDGWEQDEAGEDPELGHGGICQDIADAIAGVLSDHGIECCTVSAECGEQHVWAVALVDGNAWSVDISPYAYERGGGYSWRKIPGVQFSPEDIELYMVGDSQDFKSMLGESTDVEGERWYSLIDPPDRAFLCDYVDLGDGYALARYNHPRITAERNYWYINKADDTKAGELILRQKEGEWYVAEHRIFQHERGKGLGRRAVKALRAILGPIGSNHGTTSEVAVKMWQAVGAKRLESPANSDGARWRLEAINPDDTTAALRFPADKWVTAGSRSVSGATAARLAREGKLLKKKSPYSRSAYWLYRRPSDD